MFFENGEEAMVEGASIGGGNIRVDTHARNLPMRAKIEARGFVRCGIIHVADGTPRIAYQYDLEQPEAGQEK